MMRSSWQVFEGRVPTHPAYPLVGGVMSVQAISWVLESSEARLGPRHVLISIANHAKADGTGAWPSVATIARESRLSEREVQYAFKVLEDLGELHRQISKSGRGTTLYSLPKMTGAKSAPLRVQIPARGVQNPTKTAVDFAPEPKSIEPSLKTTVKVPHQIDERRVALQKQEIAKRRREGWAYA